MNGPDLLLPAPVQAAPLPEVRNHTPYPSQYFQMMDVGDEVFHVIASRITYDLTRLDEQGAPPLAAVQAPLVEADDVLAGLELGLHHGEPLGTHLLGAGQQVGRAVPQREALGHDTRHTWRRSR